MTWLVVCAIFGAIFGAAWRVDQVRKRKQPVRRAKHDAFRDNYNAEDWFADAKSYRRPPAAGGGFFDGDC